jgi:uncharacterized membrane protein
MELGALFSIGVFLIALLSWAKSQHLGQEALLWRFSIAEVAAVCMLVNVHAPMVVYIGGVVMISAMIGSIEMTSSKTVGAFSVGMSIAIAVILGFLLPTAMLTGLSVYPYMAYWWVVPCWLLTYTAFGRRLSSPLKKQVKALGWI